MKKLINLFLLLALISCSNDELEPNGFNFNREYYAVKNLIVQEGINNQTKLIFMGANDFTTGLPETIVEISVETASLQETVEQVSASGFYRFQAKPFFEEDVYDYGTTILDWSSSDTYQIGNGTVNIIRLDDAAIELSATITRADGEVITGYYLGRYQD